MYLYTNANPYKHTWLFLLLSSCCLQLSFQSHFHQKQINTRFKPDLKGCVVRDAFEYSKKKFGPEMLPVCDFHYKSPKALLDTKQASKKEKHYGTS